MTPRGTAAQTDTTRSVSGDSERAMQLFVRGLTATRTGDSERAAALFGEAARLAPNEPAILLSLSEVRATLDEIETALFYAARAAELDDSVEYLRHLARLQVAASELARAEATARELGFIRLLEQVRARAGRAG